MVVWVEWMIGNYCLRSNNNIFGLMGTAACCSEDPNNTSTPTGVGENNLNLQKNSVEQLQKAVDCLFRKYDHDGNGFLDKK